MTAFKITLPLGTAAFIASLGATLAAGGLIATAPPANAGCQYGGLVISKCDGPVQPDGTWQRCVVFTHWVPSGASSYQVPERRCDLMGPDQHPWGLEFADPPMHIDDSASASGRNAPCGAGAEWAAAVGRLGRCAVG